MNNKCEPHFSFKRINHAMNGPPAIEADAKGGDRSRVELHKSPEQTSVPSQVESSTVGAETNAATSAGGTGAPEPWNGSGA